MEQLKIILGLLGVAVAGFIYYKLNKAKSAEALLENQESKEKLLEKDKAIGNNNASLTLEEKLREATENQAKEEKSKDLSDEDLAKFFNNRK